MRRIMAICATASLSVAAGLACRAEELPRLDFKPGIWEFTYQTDTRERDNGAERTSVKSRTQRNKIATPRSVDIFLTYFLGSHNNEEHCRYLYLTTEPTHIRAEHLCDYQLDAGPMSGRTFSTKIDLSMQTDGEFTGETFSNQTLRGRWVMIEHETVRGHWVSAHR